MPRPSASCPAVPGFQELRNEIRQVLDADDRIPFVRRRGACLYNFWQDAAHPRGLWRRTTLEEYRRAPPHWGVLLGVAAVGAEEGEDLGWQGGALPPRGGLPPGALGFSSRRAR